MGALCILSFEDNPFGFGFVSFEKFDSQSIDLGLEAFFSGMSFLPAEFTNNVKIGIIFVKYQFFLDQEKILIIFVFLHQR
jgi:hypothetical protein